jgi:hypothetical protein
MKKAWPSRFDKIFRRAVDHGKHFTKAGQANLPSLMQRKLFTLSCPEKIVTETKEKEEYGYGNE